MSRSTSAVAVLALACVAATATAAAQMPRPRFGVGLGLTAPRGEYRVDASGEGFNAGWQGMGFMELMAPRGPVGLRVDAIFANNPGNSQLNADATGPTVDTWVKVNMRTFGANLDVIFRRSSRGGGAYLLGGIGSYRVTRANTYGGPVGGVTHGMSETRFAWNAGGGLTYPVGRPALFLEARYISVTNPFILSGKAPFVAIVAGVRFGRA
jgi:opacity protein-like surface antigen